MSPNLYLILQHINNGYDTYDSAVVAAHSEEAAKHIHPRQSCKGEWWNDQDQFGALDTWALPNQVCVFCIGTAAPHIRPGTVLCTSYRAG